MAKIKAKLTPEQKKQRNEQRKYQQKPQSSAGIPQKAMRMKPYNEQRLDRPINTIYNDFLSPYLRAGTDKAAMENLVAMTLMVWNTVSELPDGDKKSWLALIEENTGSKIKFMQKFLLRSMLKRRKKSFGQYDFYLADPRVREKDGDFVVQVSGGTPL